MRVCCYNNPCATRLESPKRFTSSSSLSQNWSEIKRESVSIHKLLHIHTCMPPLRHTNTLPEALHTHIHTFSRSLALSLAHLTPHSYRLITRGTYERHMFDIASKKLAMDHLVLQTGKKNSLITTADDTDGDPTEKEEGM